MSDSSTQSADERAEHYIDLMERGLTYAQVAEEVNSTRDAVRNSIRRYNERKFGQYKGFDPDLVEESPYEQLTGRRIPKNYKILVMDIETAPATGFYFQAKTRYIPMDSMIEDGRMLCFAARWLDGPMMFSSEWDHGREGMLKFLWKLLDEADAVVTYNGDNFDIPYVNSELVKEGLPRYAPFKSIDLIKTVRKQFRMMYNKLDFLTQTLLDERKLETGGMSLWRSLLLDKTDEAKELFRSYNKKDVDLTTDLYFFLRPWIDNHPAVTFDDDFQCRSCGSEDLTYVGWKTAVMMRYPMYRCGECSSLVRESKGGERISNVYGV